MSDEDPIEDDWKISRPVRRDPDEEPPPPARATMSYVWVSLSYRGSEIPGRFRVEVPTTKSPVIREGSFIRQPEEVYIVQGELQPDLGGYRYDQLNLYLTETSRRCVANASGTHMQTYQGPLDWVDLSFIIDGPGKLTVLHPPFEYVDGSGAWRVSPWFDEAPPGEPSREITEETRRLLQHGIPTEEFPRGITGLTRRGRHG
jgi:hypothetical protein